LIVVTHFAVMSLMPAGSITALTIRQTLEAVDAKVSGRDADTVLGMTPADTVPDTLSSADGKSSPCSPMGAGRPSDARWHRHHARTRRRTRGGSALLNRRARVKQCGVPTLPASGTPLRVSAAGSHRHSGECRGGPPALPRDLGGPGRRTAARRL